MRSERVGMQQTCGRSEGPGVRVGAQKAQKCAASVWVSEWRRFDPPCVARAAGRRAGALTSVMQFIYTCEQAQCCTKNQGHLGAPGRTVNYSRSVPERGNLFLSVG